MVADISSTIPMHESNVSSSWANAHYIGSHIYFIDKLNNEKNTKVVYMCSFSFYVVLSHCHLTTSVDSRMIS